MNTNGKTFLRMSAMFMESCNWKKERNLKDSLTTQIYETPTVSKQQYRPSICSGSGLVRLWYCLKGKLGHYFWALKTNKQTARWSWPCKLTTESRPLGMWWSRSGTKVFKSTRLVTIVLNFLLYPVHENNGILCPKTHKSEYHTLVNDQNTTLVCHLNPLFSKLLCFYNINHPFITCRLLSKHTFL